MIPSLRQLAVRKYLYGFQEVIKGSIRLVTGEVWILQWETDEGAHSLTLHGFTDVEAWRVFASFKFRHFAFWDGFEFLQMSEGQWLWLDDEGGYHANGSDHRGKIERHGISL